jgi:hypothetical protein
MSRVGVDISKSKKEKNNRQAGAVCQSAHSLANALLRKCQNPCHRLLNHGHVHSLRRPISFAHQLRNHYGNHKIRELRTSEALSCRSRPLKQPQRVYKSWKQEPPDRCPRFANSLSPFEQKLC